MKRWLTVVLILALVVGCVAKPLPVPVIEKNPRIIERDLSRVRIKIERPVAATPVPQIECPAGEPAAIEQKKEPLTFEVEFVNDSSSKLLAQGREALQEIEARAGGAESVVLIGYSNGFTAVGNSLLASRRADFVAEQLEGFGLSRNKIKTMASWSPKVTKEDPAKGVQVFMMVVPGEGEKTSGRTAT